MTNKEMIEWYADYKGYTLSATKNSNNIQRRIVAYLYMDLSQGILTRNKLQENKALKGLEEFSKLSGLVLQVVNKFMSYDSITVSPLCLKPFERK